MREAQGVAHVLAGTAGMFGQAQLGQIARQVEAEIKAIPRDDPTIANDKAKLTIGRLVAALRVARQRSASLSPLRAA
jgi:HPt (histidine-containing phosphotransfer) domain-containing protein